MTTPEERRRAVLETRQFLIFLAQPSREADVPDDIRYQAEALLRHYPYATDMDIAGLAYLNWLKEDKQQRLTDMNPLLEKMVKHAEPVLIATAVGFVCVSVILLVSLSHKFG